MMSEIVVVRGAGDIATGAIQKLNRSGFKVVALEIEKPTSIRRRVCLSEAMYENEFKVEDVVAKRADSYNEIFSILNENKVCIVNDISGEIIKKIKPMAVVDATLCKKNIGTNRSMADITVALGPGYIAGKDVDIVVETNRGHNLGRLIFNGSAAKNTGVPGIIEGFGIERVIYSPCEGNIEIIKDIGSIVEEGETICIVGDKYVRASLTGVIRGMIRNGFYVNKGLKIADIDPRINQKKNCDLISDKARCIGGAVLESIMMLRQWRNR
ncbi:selenium-dependent molybdenum cofactor biosynthesis protein YqeB [Clostridium perfringens]|nr:selenium-dependent molybdenum cofactor biosynthesis protein YqeB [Clostridium perfringens]EJT6341099.1 EF2563 family selenium-dependent molybdenum hydroxylase system protein [Clostridium perfringens]MCX0410348.1 EF2563 family selenium-dependent molybdenum hydroxylase system protein [Clostridium perfringens]MDM1006754.1 selenium-dependent molybdenum cofactor biosynthesis protein YqeB [Clostridium perfringens]HCG3018640.1 EF2563 family selenium-dependent molybdenum hydroxylase system protein [